MYHKFLAFSAMAAVAGLYQTGVIAQMSIPSLPGTTSPTLPDSSLLLQAEPPSPQQLLEAEAQQRQAEASVPKESEAELLRQRNAELAPQPSDEELQRRDEELLRESGL
jgi:hypothetical protein